MSCTQCGASGVDGICSMCYGDIDHNTDGFYRQWAEEQSRQYEEMEEQDQAEAYLKKLRKQQEEFKE